VPGLLSSGGGRDFGAILGALEKCGYGFAYRILDAQYFGVPQRRRRLFVVGHLGDWRPAAAVLFEREGLRRDPPPRRSQAERVAPTLESRPSGRGSNWGTDFLASGGLAVEVAALEASAGRSRGAGTPIGMLAVTPLLEIGTRKQHGVVTLAGTRPRRLTPRECERLQGLPDDWTAIEYRGKPAADGPRYRAIGNSMAAPVIAWLVSRIRQTDRIA
jgi:DNA (cytosine-5)-methyltransferase 1